MLASETEKEEVRAARGGMLVLLRSSLFGKTHLTLESELHNCEAQKQSLNAPGPMHCAVRANLNVLRSLMGLLLVRCLVNCDV